METVVFEPSTQGFCWLAFLPGEEWALAGQALGANPSARDLAHSVAAQSYSWSSDVAQFTRASRQSTSWHCVVGRFRSCRTLGEWLSSVDPGVTLGNLVPTKADYPDIEADAWIGDAMLTTFLREACVNVTGGRDGAWVDSLRSNATLAKYMRSQGYLTHLYSDKTVGTAFEALYYSDAAFREAYNATLPVTPSSGRVTDGAGAPCEGYCWKQLFRSNPVSIHPWVRQRALSKRQLLELARTNPLKEEPHFDVQHFGKLLHVVAGNKTPSTLLSLMSNSQQLGQSSSIPCDDGGCLQPVFEAEHPFSFPKTLFIPRGRCKPGDPSPWRECTPQELAELGDEKEIYNRVPDVGFCWLLAFDSSIWEELVCHGPDLPVPKLKELIRLSPNRYLGSLDATLHGTTISGSWEPKMYHLRRVVSFGSSEQRALSCWNFNLPDDSFVGAESVERSNLLLPTDRIKTNLSPFVGDKLRAEKRRAFMGAHRRVASEAPRARRACMRTERSFSEPPHDFPKVGHVYELMPLVALICEKHNSSLTEAIAFAVASDACGCPHNGVEARSFTCPGLCWCSEGSEDLEDFLFKPLLPWDDSGVGVAHQEDSDNEMSQLSAYDADGIYIAKPAAWFPGKGAPVMPEVLAYREHLEGELCWKGLFPEWDDAEWMFVQNLFDLTLSYYEFVEDLPWDHLELSRHGSVWHVANPTLGQVSPAQIHIEEVLQQLHAAMEADPDVAEEYVELTTAVVLGTIGDVEPTLDVVAANHFSALTQAEDASPWDGKFIFDEQGHGWCASDFLDACPSFARALDDKYGAAKGTLQVMTSLWNKICHVWGGEPWLDDQQAQVAPGHYGEDPEEVFNIVPERPVGSHERKLPEDFTLVTHPDHLERLLRDSPDMMSGVSVHPVPVKSHDFIKLGQDILEGGLWALKDMKQMQLQLLQALKTTFPIIEQSDLVYLVSGTTFHYFIGSLFPHKQVYEICPVPREDNGTCPEFYLGHYASFFSDNPRFSHALGRAYNQWITAPVYLKELEWSGEYKYFEPPKFHSVMPWAQAKWKIESPNVGFKPYDDFIIKKRFVEVLRPRVYFSLGSCEKVTKETAEVLKWLRSLPCVWVVDPRWTYLFEGCEVEEPGFFPHSTGLANFDWVIHHGGSGVTNTCLAVKVPQTILPQIGDQFVWRDALVKHVIRPFTPYSQVLAHLFHERLPPKRAEEFATTPEFAKALQTVGAWPVEPFWLSLHCCHDWNEYGFKDLDMVIGESERFWFTLYDTTMQRTGKPGPLQLKWVLKECSNASPPIWGWRGTNINATYPRHAHGWVGDFVPREGVDSSLEIDPNWFDWLAKGCLTSKDPYNPYRSRRPTSGTCKRCLREGRELLFQHCSRCVGDIVAEVNQTGEVPDLPPLTKWLNSARKAPSKSKAVGLQLSGSNVRSTRRYFQVDTRMLDKAPIRVVARALMDKIEDWSSVKWIEAFWWYTNSLPPHYRLTTNPERAVNEVASQHAEVTMGGLAQDVVVALGAVLSVSSTKSLARRLIGMNVLSAPGRGVIHSKWHVLVDALRHYSALAESLNIEVMPRLVKSVFPKIEELDVSSYIHYKRGIASPIRTRSLTHAWLDQMAARPATIRIHLFSLRVQALGPLFGVYHAIVEYGGKFWELQQVSGNYTLINKSNWRPEGTPDRPLVKTLIVTDPVVGPFPEKLIHREFSGNDYKVLGDNCLVFANFLVYQVTGKVVPWKHFGVFGKDLTFELTSELRQWATSFFFPSGNEHRVSLAGVDHKAHTHFSPLGTVARERRVAGPRPKVKDYGLHALRLVEKVIEDYDRAGPEDTPWGSDAILDLALLGYKKFGLSSHLVSQALLKIRLSRIPQRKRKIALLERLMSTLRKLPSTRLAQDVMDVFEASSKLRAPLREGRKPAWAPLLNITVPRHWFREKDRLVEVPHLPENLNMAVSRVVKLDLPQIAKRYETFFPGVQFPKMGFRFVRPGEYEIGVKVNLRKNLPKMDELTLSLIRDLQEMHPFELGIFSLRFGTVEMAEKVTDRYFTGALEAGQLIPDEQQQEIAEAIFRNNRALYEKAQLISPEEVWKKWHKNYSAGFPFRFNARGNAKRQELIDAIGGREAFLNAVRSYIEHPEAFPTVSHAFIKDEVLPASYVDREKIRTIIAQDPLNYFREMAVLGDHAKRMDPNTFSAVGVSPAHGEMSALAEKHLPYRYHYAMDITALDSTAAVDAVETIKRLHKLGYTDHPQREAIESNIDAVLTNLQASWIIDIHSGRGRLKNQGFTTGHAATTSENTRYVEVMILKAWHDITGRPYDDFYECVRYSSFSDDGFWSTDLPPTVFSAKLMEDYWLSRGVQIRVEGQSESLGDISFLAKRFSFDEAHLAEIRQHTTRDPKVAVVHDTTRLLQKFSDYKKKNTLAYRWEKLVALQANCAHHRDIYDKVSEYLDALESEMTRRQFMRRFIKQHPRKSYHDIMVMMYEPGAKESRSGLILTNQDKSLQHKLLLWWDTLRVDIMAFDSTANSYARVLNQFAGLLELGGLSVEDPGVFLQQPGEMPKDPEFTLEHHCWLLNGCPGTFEQFRMLLQKTPFSAFCDAEGFWARRERFDISEECANGLRAKVILLQAIYTVVAWLEKTLQAVPVVGTVYKVFCTAKGLSEKMYSRLNALYYAMFGSSSLILSSLMPKDNYLSMKVLAFRVFVLFTSTDNLDFAGNLDDFQGFVDSVSKLAADVHNLVFELDISSLVPRPDTEEDKRTGLARAWEALDHTHSVNECVDLMEAGSVPLVQGPTGCGKSTDFVLNLYERFDTVIVACPRRVLVRNSPVAQRKLYSGSQDSLTPGLVNFGTAGYLRRVLGELPQSTILVLDEFHELDEDTLWLHSRYQGQVIAVTATPSFPNSDSFSPVVLTKSRNAGHVITSSVADTAAKLEDAWHALIDTGLDDTRRTLVIVPTLRMVTELTRHAVRLAPQKRVCELYRGHDEVKVGQDWYFATSVVDAGLTIPGLQRVIDCGWSSGFSGGKFVTRPSSRNIMDQRRGRTGRDCDGEYLRLNSKFVEDPWDFTTPFLFNNWAVVRQWHRELARPIVTRSGCLEALPFGYENLLEEKKWSHLIYTIFYYENRGDLDRTRAAYQAARKFPDRPDVAYIMGPHENRQFLDLEPLEAQLATYTIPGTSGNFWNWCGSEVVRETFVTPIPKHLQDYD